jgi:hypothetical protein
MIELPLYLKLADITYHEMCEQERTGIKFNTVEANRLVQELTAKMKAIEVEIEPLLPKRRPLKGELKAMTPPKLQFKKDGTPSAMAEKWFDKVELKERTSTYLKGNKIPNGDDYWAGLKGGKWYVLPHHEPIITDIPMTLANQQQLKDHLLDIGWKPTFWNYKKDKKGKEIRENGKKIKTSPKLHDKGEVCPGLDRIADKAPYVKDVILWVMLRHRRSNVEGWLKHPRLEQDGRLPASSSGLTNTGRQKHVCVANIPRVTTPYGKEMRALFMASEGKVFVGYDASGLEARVKGHYTARYDEGAYAKKILSSDYDEHEENASLWDCERKDAKTPGYALQYFCGLATFCAALGVKQDVGTEYYNRYWEENWALKMVDEAVARSWEANNKKYILTIDRSKRYTRSRHSITNTLFQSTGAKIMDMSWTFLRKWLQEEGIDYKRVVYYHDEYIIECTPEDAERVGELSVQSIVQAGKFFKLKVPLDAEYKIGMNWGEVH